jgi:hypothetical protein
MDVRPLEAGDGAQTGLDVPGPTELALSYPAQPQFGPVTSSSRNNLLGAYR